MSGVRYFVPLLPAFFLLINVLRFITGRHTESEEHVFWIMVAVCVAAILISAWWAYGPKILYGLNRSARCPNCYAKLKKDTGFCPKCGAVVEGPKDSYMSHCPKCGGDIDPDREFCPHCGSMLKK